MKIVRLWLLALIIGISAAAQTNPREHVSMFNMISFTYKHDQHWSAYLESQARSIEDFSKIDYYEIKGGIGYTIAKKHQPFIGFGRYGTYKNDLFNQREYRLWLQYIFTHNLSSLKIDHRLRAEKRFFHYPQTGKTDDTERYRYRLSGTLPLNGKKLAPGIFYGNAFDEVFFGPEDPSFKRNRLFGGVGYVFNDFLNANMGYMWQREFNATPIRNLHFAYFALNFTFDRKKYNEIHMLPVAD